MLTSQEELLTRAELAEAKLAAVDALAGEWHRHCNEARDHGNPPPQVAKRHAARMIRALLDGAS